MLKVNLKFISEDDFIGTLLPGCTLLGLGLVFVLVLVFKCSFFLGLHKLLSYLHLEVLIFHGVLTFIQLVGQTLVKDRLLAKAVVRVVH